MQFKFDRSLFQRIKDLITGKAWQKSGRQPIYIATGQHGGNAGSISVEDTQQFIYNSTPAFFSSSNVASAQYFVDDEILVVSYLRPKRKNAEYLYDKININMAINLIQAVSKGETIWDLFRGGSKKTKQAIAGRRASVVSSGYKGRGRRIQ